MIIALSGCFVTSNMEQSSVCYPHMVFMGPNEFVGLNVFCKQERPEQVYIMLG